MKARLFLLTQPFCVLVLSFVSHAGHAANIEYDYATVLDAVPIYQTVAVSTPTRTCWD